MKKTLLIVVAMTLVALPAYLLVNKLQAGPVVDYGQVSPTVKIEAYKLARNGDVFKALSASATIVNPYGLLLTNSHAVLDDNNDPYDVFSVCLSFNDNEEPVCEYSAFLKAYDENLDLALLEMVGTDNRGQLISELPYLDYHYQEKALIGSPLDVYGYPDVGGDTLTRTRGQISGFENRNGITYLKTDTDISSGNSGGTALDEKGNFVGVPTYILSSIENIGYILDIKEAVDFIDLNMAAEPEVNLGAYHQLVAKKNLINNASDNNYYEHPYYPKFSLAADSNWDWELLEKTQAYLVHESNEGDKEIDIKFFPAPFKINDEHLAEFDRITGLYTEYLSNYQEEQTTFAGHPATLKTYNSNNQKYYQYRLAYGSAFIIITYSVDIDKMAEDLAIIEPVIDSFAFLEEPNDNPTIIEVFSEDEPAFSISRKGDWYLQPNQDPYNEDLIVTLANSDSLWGGMEVYYLEIEDNEKALDNGELLKRFILGLDWIGGFKLVNKSESVILDNLQGFSITYIKSSEESEKPEKVSSVFLRDGDYLYKIEYSDLVDDYDKNLATFKEVLKTFKNYKQPVEIVGKGEYKIGTLDYTFSDINYHRFEQAITKLSDKNIVYGYTDGTFRPEKAIAAGEAKKFINNSFAESKRSEKDEKGADFLVGSEIKLGEVLKALVVSYKLNVWQDVKKDTDELKPYLDKGFEIGIIPQGLVDANQIITRAEFTAILNNLLASFEVI